MKTTAESHNQKLQYSERNAALGENFDHQKSVRKLKITMKLKLKNKRTK